MAPLSDQNFLALHLSTLIPVPLGVGEAGKGNIVRRVDVPGGALKEESSGHLWWISGSSRPGSQFLELGER